MADDDQQQGLPKRRRGDRGWHVLVRENAYRDVWLVLVTVIALVAIAAEQSQRRDTIRDSCRAQNAIYHRTIAVLDRAYVRSLGLPAGTKQPVLIARLKSGVGLTLPPHETLAQVRAGYEETVLLLNAVAPVRDCSAVVSKAAPGLLDF